MSSGQSSQPLFNAAGTARRLRAAPLFAIGPSEPGPAICRGFLTVAAAFSFGLLAVQYALFTAAITTYVVLMSTTLGEAAFEAAGQRATGTALGIAIAFLAWRLWPNPVGTVDLASQPNVGGASS